MQQKDLQTWGSGSEAKKRKNRKATGSNASRQSACFMESKPFRIVLPISACRLGRALRGLLAPSTNRGPGRGTPWTNPRLAQNLSAPGMLFWGGPNFLGERVGIGVEWRFVLASHVAAAAIYPLPTSWNLGFIYRLHEHRLREVYPNPSFIFPPTPLKLPLSLPPLLIPPSLSHAVSFLHIYFLFCLCTFFLSTFLPISCSCMK